MWLYVSAQEGSFVPRIFTKWLRPDRRLEIKIVTNLSKVTKVKNREYRKGGRGVGKPQVGKMWGMWLYKIPTLIPTRQPHKLT